MNLVAKPTMPGTYASKSIVQNFVWFSQLFNGNSSSSVLFCGMVLRERKSYRLQTPTRIFKRKGIPRG